MGNARLRLKADELDLLKNYRERNKGIADECESAGIDLGNVNHYWYKGKSYSIHAKGAQVDYSLAFKDVIKEMKAFAPRYPVIKRTKQKDASLLIVDPADPHFGKRSSVSETGEETNLVTTERRFNEGIEGLINKVDCYKFDKVIYVGGNDVTHTDNPFGTTTAGTRQDTAGLWHENFQVAKKANIGAIDRLLSIADVHFVFCPSNHDFMTGFFMADTLASWYSKNKNVTFDVDPIHRKYIQYGHNLLGFTHGDGAKEGDLSDLMKTEAKKGWGMSKYAYWYVAHMHHKIAKGIKGREKVNIEKDYRGLTVFNTGLNLDPEDYCRVEYVRSMSGTDRWHFTNGYVHAPASMEAFIHHPKFGQINRINHLF